MKSVTPSSYKLENKLSDRKMSGNSEVRTRDSSVRIVIRLRVGRSEFRIPVREAYSFLLENVHIGSGVHPACNARGIGRYFSGGKSDWGVRLTIHFHVVPKLRLSGAIPPLILPAFIVCSATASCLYQI